MSGWLSRKTVHQSVFPSANKMEVKIHIFAQKQQKKFKIDFILSSHKTILSLINKKKGNNITCASVYSMHPQSIAWHKQSVAGMYVVTTAANQLHTTNSSNPNNPLSSNQNCSGHAGITPRGFEWLLPWAPTSWLWATLTQPLSWEGTEKFSEFQGNHQSTKEEGIPNTPPISLSHTHTQNNYPHV